MPSDSYDATRDPRTGRPPLPSDVEKARIEEQEKSGFATPQAEASPLLPAVETGNQEHQLPQSSSETLEPVQGEAEGNQKVGGQRPEALAQFAESAREDRGESAPKELTANEETAPIPTDNAVKHDVATQLLNDGAHGLEPDPDSAGEDRLPDRINRQP